MPKAYKLAKLNTAYFIPTIASRMAYKTRYRRPGHMSSDGKWEMTMEQFKKWLNSFDLDRDGQISRHELREAVRATDGRLSTWKAKRVVKSADANHNGFIDHNEFKNLVGFADKELNIRIIASL